MSFFERFPDFQADPTAVLADEFARLALHSGWKKKSEVYKEQRAECLVTEFHYHFDTTDKLESWQVMCLKVGIEAGESITKCKKVIVNSDTSLTQANHTGGTENAGACQHLRYDRSRKDWGGFAEVQLI